MIRSFSIHGFRGVDQENLHIDTHQAIIGENGSGKTHILEGIHIVSGSSLHYFQPPRNEVVTFSLSYEEEIGEKNYGLSRTEK